ncbi:MAG: hypothetical protein JEZ00_05250 [Anaerolineaceae bacterium]|nr:hypothetical protein [Anaerolineaceae bacterium]
MTETDRLYQLLPSIYRIRDAEQGEQLRGLLGIISDELAEVEADISGLYKNWFIETCDEWVVPYIGDLLGVRGLNTLQNTSFSQRAYVANTLFYRRRKGTASVLEILARDVTGWPAQAVEFFELLQTTQYLNHLRLFNTRPDLRETNRLNLLDTPFDSLPHTADVRHIYNQRGKHNIPNVGIFLWRLQNYPLMDIEARQAAAPNAHGYHFSSLGNPAPLFNAPAMVPLSSSHSWSQNKGYEEGTDEQLVPTSIRPLDFRLDLKTFQEKYASSTPPENSRYYGPKRSLQLIKDGTPVPPQDILCKNLSAWARPPAGTVALDAVRGRITFPAGEEPSESLTVSYNYGFSADIGGGPYDRRERISEVNLPVEAFDVGTGKTYADLAAALSDWNVSKPPAVIRIYDSGTYNANLTINLPINGSLVIDCENEERPTLINASPLTVTCAATTPEEAAAFTLNGLVIEGALDVSGKLDLTITDCTLVPGISLDEDGYPKQPGAASLVVSGTDVVDTAIHVSRSILGPLELPEECRELVIRDSIVCAPQGAGASEPARAAIAANATGSDPGPVLTVERTTIFGQVHVKQLELGSESIFVHPLTVDRRQEGCLRFSYIPEGSQTPRRYRCQPDLAIATREDELDPASLSSAERDKIIMRLRPQFTALRYGQPAYAQLSTSCACEIKTGAEKGAEIGAFCMLQQPQRMENLRIALDEYLRFGLEAGIFFVT